MLDLTSHLTPFLHINTCTFTPLRSLNHTDTQTQREHGRKAQLSNIQAARAVADIIRTTLGPRAMLKMILDPTGNIQLTNDGNTILREVDVAHPAAKNMIELSRTQDEEVGDGTTSVIVLTSELLKVSEPFLLKNMHPRIIIAAYYKALDVALEQLSRHAITLDIKDKARLLQIVNTTLGTKFTARFGDLIANLAIDAVRTVYCKNESGAVEIDVKRYVRVERIVGDYLENSHVLDGILLNKDVVDSKMARRIENPRIVLLDCNLEYKKAESMTNVEITKEEDWDVILKQEEDYIQNMCNAIVAVKPDLVITEKGVSELAAHYLHKAGCSVLRRLKKTDNNRIARATGATIVHDPRDLKETDVGLGCGLFEVRKIGDEYYSYIEKCKDPKACTVILRGASKDILQEIERNLQDAMAVVRNIMLDPRIVPGGGASEMSVAAAIYHNINTIPGTQQAPYKAVAAAMEIIPRTLSENCGAKTIRLITELRAKHHINVQSGDDEGFYWGIDGVQGELTEINKLDLWEPMLVKTQTLKTAIEAASMLLRIDAIVSGLRNPEAKGDAAGAAPNEEGDE
jgi:T-complex protein 1 subunit gamma